MATIAFVDLFWIACAAGFGMLVPPATFAAQIIKANALAIVLELEKR